MKIDKRYTIRFSYAGYYQYADFYEKDGKLHNPHFRMSYSKDDTPSVDNLETIEEVLEVIKSVSYCNRATIHLINGSPASYYDKAKAKKIIVSISDKLDKLKEEEAINFFVEILEPLMKENKWFVSTSHIGFPILIEKDEEGEWDNVKNDSKEFDFEFLCYKFASQFRTIKINLKPEHSGPNARGFKDFISLIGIEYMEKKGYFIEV